MPTVIISYIMANSFLINLCNALSDSHGISDEGEPEAFGFINPEDVIRGVHVIPAFCYGRTKNLLPPSIACNKSENDEDWDWYYVNM